MSRIALSLVVVFLASVPLTAQRGRGGASRQSSLPAANSTAPDLVASFAGKVLIATKKQFTIVITDEHELTFKLNGKTDFFDGAKKMKLEDLAVGDIVAVDAKRDAVGQLDAVHIKLQKVPELEPAPSPAPTPAAK